MRRILRIMAGMRRIGNAEMFYALSTCYDWNADIMQRFLRIPVRILPSAFSPHFFPHKNAEISPHSCPNTPIRISSTFPPHFFPYKNAEISPRSCPNTPGGENVEIWGTGRGIQTNPTGNPGSRTNYPHYIGALNHFREFYRLWKAKASQRPQQSWPAEEGKLRCIMGTQEEVTHPFFYSCIFCYS